MRLSQVTTAVAVLFAPVTSALHAPPGHEHIAPTKANGYVRSPCPGLNSLANHGFIHRDGRNMTIPHLIAGGKQGVNVDAEFMAISAVLGLQAVKLTGLSFDLDELRVHNFPIEHDASMVHQDHYFGQVSRLHKREYNMFMDTFGDAEYADLATASIAKSKRVKDTLDNNPQHVYGPQQVFATYAETSVALQTMASDPLSAKAPMSYLRSFFHEKLPYELGWQKSEIPIGFHTCGVMSVELQSTNPNVVDEDIAVVTPGAFKDALIATLREGRRAKELTAILKKLGIPI